MKPAYRLSAGALALSLFSVGAAAHDVVFYGTLAPDAGSALSPPSQGTGSVVAVFNDDEYTIDLSFSFSGLSGTTTAAHLHCCTLNPGVGTSGVASPVPSFPGFETGVTAGSYHQFFDLTQAGSWNPAFLAIYGNSINDAFSAFSTGMNEGTVYLNIHTSLATGGEVRAFLSSVPEPASWGLLTLGLLAVGGAARRSRA